METWRAALNANQSFPFWLLKRLYIEKFGDAPDVKALHPEPFKSTFKP